MKGQDHEPIANPHYLHDSGGCQGKKRHKTKARLLWKTMARRQVFFRPIRRNSNRKALSISFLIEEAIEDVEMMELLDAVDSVGDICWGTDPVRPYVEEIPGKGCYETEFGPAKDEENESPGKQTDLKQWIEAALRDSEAKQDHASADHSKPHSSSIGSENDGDDRSWTLV